MSGGHELRISAPRSLERMPTQCAADGGDGATPSILRLFWADPKDRPELAWCWHCPEDCNSAMRNIGTDMFCDDNSREVESGIEAFFSDDSVVIKNRNTTVGYVLFSKAENTINYIFVNPRFRRQGFGWLLVDLAQRECGAKLAPAEPISPLGRKFFKTRSPSVSPKGLKPARLFPAPIRKFCLLSLICRCSEPGGSCRSNLLLSSSGGWFWSARRRHPSRTRGSVHRNRWPPRRRVSPVGSAKPSRTRSE